MLQVLCSVINSTYDPSACSCNEQLNIYDTCASKYPCLRVHISYKHVARPPPTDLNNESMHDENSYSTSDLNENDGNENARTENARTERRKSGIAARRFSIAKNRTKLLEAEVLQAPDIDSEELIDADVETPAMDNKMAKEKEMVAILYRSWDDSFHKQVKFVHIHTHNFVRYVDVPYNIHVFSYDSRFENVHVTDLIHFCCRIFAVETRLKTVELAHLLR